MYINVESGEMDQLYKGEIVLCYIFLDVLPLISQEIEKKDFFSKQRLPRKSKHLFWANSRMLVQTKFYKLKIGVSFNFLTDNTA